MPRRRLRRPPAPRLARPRSPRRRGYEVELTVKVEVDKSDVKASVPAFLLTEGGKLVPGVSMSKSGSAATSFKGDEPPAKAVAEMVDTVVANLCEKLVSTLEKLK